MAAPYVTGAASLLLSKKCKVTDVTYKGQKPPNPLKGESDCARNGTPPLGGWGACLRNISKVKETILKNVEKIEQLSEKTLTGGRLNACTDTCKHAIYHSPYKNQKFGTIETKTSITTN